jgi:hypothetical protein
MAERNGVDLRRELLSDDFFSERASARGLLSLKTPDSRSSALLVFVTREDQRFALTPFEVERRRTGAFDGFLAAMETKHCCCDAARQAPIP